MPKFTTIYKYKIKLSREKETTKNFGKILLTIKNTHKINNAQTTRMCLIIKKNKKYFNKVSMFSELNPQKDSVLIPLELDVNNCIATKIAPIDKIKYT